MKNQINIKPQTTIKTKLVNNNIDNSNSQNGETFLSSIVIFQKIIYIIYNYFKFVNKEKQKLYKYKNKKTPH